jgi:hypothetical protein
VREGKLPSSRRKREFFYLGFVGSPGGLPFVPLASACVGGAMFDACGGVLCGDLFEEVGRGAVFEPGLEAACFCCCLCCCPVLLVRVRVRFVRFVRVGNDNGGRRVVGRRVVGRRVVGLHAFVGHGGLVIVARTLEGGRGTHFQGFEKNEMNLQGRMFCLVVCRPDLATVVQTGAFGRTVGRSD